MSQPAAEPTLPVPALPAMVGGDDGAALFEDGLPILRRASGTRMTPPSKASLRAAQRMMQEAEERFSGRQHQPPPAATATTANTVNGKPGRVLAVEALVEAPSPAPVDGGDAADAPAAAAAWTALPLVTIRTNEGPKQVLVEHSMVGSLDPSTLVTSRLAGSKRPAEDEEECQGRSGSPSAMATADAAADAGAVTAADAVDNTKRSAVGEVAAPPADAVIM